MRRFSTSKLYDPIRERVILKDLSIRDVLEGDLLLVRQPKAFNDLNKGQQDFIRYKCYEFSGDEVLKFLFDSLTYEQSMSTINGAKEMKEVDAGRYTNYGVLGVRRLIEFYAAKPKEVKDYNKYKLFGNS